MFACIIILLWFKTYNQQTLFNENVFEFSEYEIEVFY